MSRDPEIAELQRESLRLIIASEKVLTALEDHIALLRAFVGTARATQESESAVPPHTHGPSVPTPPKEERDDNSQ